MMLVLKVALFCNRADFRPSKVEIEFLGWGYPHSAKSMGNS